MTIEEKLAFKKEIKAVCIQMLNERIADTRTAMNAAQDSANSEEKSSAGDKYETGRAMSQIERDNYAAKLEESLHEMMLLQSIDADKIYDHVSNGALIRSANALYFIATGIGMITMPQGKVAVLSPLSPLAAAMRDKKVGDEITFGGRNYLIDEIY